jgi:MFS family permease
VTSDLAGSDSSAGADPAALDRPTQRTLRHWLVGPPHVDRLTLTHCLHVGAEAFFTVSMAGSIFFSVSPDAARPRVLLFLVLTLAPFLVMAPLVGSTVDRIRGGLATTMVATFALRAVLAVMLAENLRSLFLFPLVFGMLVVAKTYTVAKNALVPSLVEDEHDLVSANARMSRTATFAGALAAGAAVLVYTTTSGAWSLRLGAVVYVVGAVFAWRVRSVAPRLEPVGRDAFVELVRPDVTGAVWDMVVLRAALGFALFQFGFSLRADGDPAWVLGALIFANGFGGFAGTVVSPWLRRHTSERSMFTTALVGSALVALAAGIVFNRATLISAIFVLGTSVSIGRRALDATIQRQAPHARSGQVYAGIETRLELAWVGAACLAVALRVASWIGMLALATFLALVAIVHLRRRRGLLAVRPLGATSLPERLLLRAETLAAHRYYDEAIVVALSALDEACGDTAEPPLTRAEVRALADPSTEVAPEDAIDVIERVRRQLDSRG